MMTYLQAVCPERVSFEMNVGKDGVPESVGVPGWLYRSVEWLVNNEMPLLGVISIIVFVIECQRIEGGMDGGFLVAAWVVGTIAAGLVALMFMMCHGVVCYPKLKGKFEKKWSEHFGLIQSCEE